MKNDLSRLRALQAVASRVNASSDVDETMQHLLRAFCQETSWVSGAIMRVDAGRRHVQVISRYDPAGLVTDPERLWPFGESPARVALETGRPVILPDAQRSPEYPGYQREAKARRYRTVVLLPMEFDGEARRDTVLTASSREVVSVGETEMAFLELVVHLGSIAIGKARSLARERDFAARLNAVLAGHATLLDTVLDGGSVPMLVDRVAELIARPFVLIDLTSRRVWARRSPWPDLAEPDWIALANGEARASLLKLAKESGEGADLPASEVTIRAGRRLLKGRAVTAPLRVDGALVGALVTFGASDPEALDHLLIDAARFGLSVQMMRAQVTFAAEARSLDDLLTRLVEGTLPEIEAQDRGAQLGIAFDRPGRLVVLAPLAGPDVKLAARTEALRASLDRAKDFDRGATAFARADLVVALCPYADKDEERWRRLVDDLIREVRLSLGREVVAVSSRVCTAIRAYAEAFRDAEGLVALARRFGRSGPVGPEDFGPLTILMASVDPGGMRAFVQGLAGALAAHDAAKGTAYRETLLCYLDRGGRLQPAADALGLHVTTLRYRLARAKELFGLKMETPDQRFALHVALRYAHLVA